jgi:DNA uptake protein ComE-like DNA-binding protein
MAKGHWLDPLARRLLIATGQLPAAPRGSASGQSSHSSCQETGESTAAIERELLAMKLAANPALRLRNADEVRQLAALGWRLDVNRATAADWLRLPGCTPSQVDLLLRLQAGGVQLSGLDDLQRLLSLPEERLSCWQPLLAFHWYSEGATPGLAPIDLNRSSADQLGSRLPLDAERCRRLVRERGRGPFQDLADLQQRLDLPADLVEALIGKVSFGKGPVGPELPRPSQAPPPR